MGDKPIIVVPDHAIKNAACVLGMRQAGLHFYMDSASAKLSGVRPQPYGFDETRRGALNRGEALLHAVPEATFAIGIENGLEPGTPGDFADFGVVALVERGKPSTCTRSLSIPVPMKYALAAMDSGFEKTWGQLMAADLGSDHADPHSFLTGGRLSRTTILQQAVLAACAIKFK